MSWKAIAVVMVGLLAWSVVARADVVVGGLGNDQQLGAFVGFGEPNEGLLGPYARWHEGTDGPVWGAGIRAEYDVSKPVWDTLHGLFNVPASWAQFFAAIDAHPYLAGELGPANLTGHVRAYSGLGIGMRFGPFTIECLGQLFEGGQIRDGDSLLAESGLTWTLGLRRRF